jgi:hypothetical protein
VLGEGAQGLTLAIGHFIRFAWFFEEDCGNHTSDPEVSENFTSRNRALRAERLMSS